MPLPVHVLPARRGRPSVSAPLGSKSGKGGRRKRAHLHGRGLAGPLPTLPALLVWSPCFRHLLFSSFLQFHNHCPFHVSGAVWLGRIPRGFLSSASLLSQPLSLLPWATLKLPALQTQVPFFLIILFLLKARLPYHENHCQTTGPQGPTQHVPSYSGNRSETAHTHAGSGAPAARYNCVFTDLSALLPVLSAGSHVLFVHWPQDEKPCTDG